MKINIVGSSGSGKSTLARRLSTHFELTYIEMDSIFWKDNWEESSFEEFANNLSRVIPEDDWVLDGNYSKTNYIKWEDIDMIVWLDYGFLRTFYQCIKRSLYRSFTKNQIWGNSNNKETFKRVFLSSDSIILFMIKNYRKNRLKFLMDIQNNKDIKFIVLKSPKETKAFLKTLGIFS